MIHCESCQSEWDETSILDSEGLRHFYAPNEVRRIAEKSGHVWVVKFSDTKSIVALTQCRKCPIILSGLPLQLLGMDS